jgi:uncharacterized protein YqhQ
MGAGPFLARCADLAKAGQSCLGWTSTFFSHRHVYDPLDEESEKKLRRKAVVVKVVYIASLFLVCAILIAILLSAIADIYDETAKIRAYLFILPGLAFLALLINIAFGHNGG